MSGKPRPIPAKAAELWSKGDEAGASKLSGLQSRQLRNRLGPPGRPVEAPPSAPASPPPPAAPQKLVRVPPRPPGPPPPVEPPSEPTTAEIEAVDTRTEAEAIYRDVRGKMADADPVRFASLAEKALAALNRLEQIDKRRPAGASPEELADRRILATRERAVERIGGLAGDAAAAWAARRSSLETWALESLGPVLGAEVTRRVGVMLGEGSTV